MNDQPETTTEEIAAPEATATPVWNGPIEIHFTDEVVQKFSSAKAARAFLRGRGFTVANFQKLDGGIWVPTEAIAEQVASADLNKRATRPGKAPLTEEEIAAIEAAKAEKLAEKEAARQAKAAQKEADKAAKAQAKEAAAAEKQAAEAAKAEKKAALNNVSLEEICPSFGIMLKSVEDATGGTATQADVYDVIMAHSQWDPEMSQTDRQKVAKRLARTYKLA